MPTTEGTHPSRVLLRLGGQAATVTIVTNADHEPDETRTLLSGAGWGWVEASSLPDGTQILTAPLTTAMPAHGLGGHGASDLKHVNWRTYVGPAPYEVQGHPGRAAQITISVGANGCQYAIVA